MYYKCRPKIKTLFFFGKPNLGFFAEMREKAMMTISPYSRLVLMLNEKRKQCNSKAVLHSMYNTKLFLQRKKVTEVKWEMRHNVSFFFTF